MEPPHREPPLEGEAWRLMSRPTRRPRVPVLSVWFFRAARQSGVSGPKGQQTGSEGSRRRDMLPFHVVVSLPVL